MQRKELLLNHCGWMQCNPSGGWGPAVRDHYLIHLVTAGEGKFLVEGEEYTVKAGQGFLIAPNVSTIYITNEKNPWEYYWVGFSGDEALSLLQDCGISPSTRVFLHHLDATTAPVLKAIMSSFNVYSGNSLHDMGYLYLYISLIRPYESSKNTVKHYISKALQYIDSNYSYEISIADIAWHLRLNRSYFYKIFMHEMNCSPQQYLRDFRLERAQSLLLNSDINITEAAMSSGFKDLTHFSAAYKKKYGHSPSADKRKESKM